MNDTLRVAVIEDDSRYRRSLETLFQLSPGFRLAGSFDSAQSALDALDRQPKAEWDLVLMDLHLPGIDGIEATRRVKALLPGVAVVVLTVFEDPETVLEAIVAGADGYMLKKSSASELLGQLRTIANGGSPLTGGVARIVLDLVRSKQTGSAMRAAPVRLDITEREQEVLRALVRGRSYKQVAGDLEVSLDTVRTHIRGVYKKLQVHSAAEAVARAIRDRLV